MTNLFIRSPKLNDSTSSGIANNNKVCIEIINRPSRGGAVLEVEAFNQGCSINKDQTTSSNKFNPFNPFLPLQNKDRIPNGRQIDFRPMSNAGLPPLKSMVKSPNELLNPFKVDNNLRNPNPLQDCVPVSNLEALNLNLKNLYTDFLTNLKNNPFQSKKLKDSVPEVGFVLFKLKELAATKNRNILRNILASNNISSLINCVITKAIVKNEINDYIVTYRNLTIDDVEIQNVYENYLQKLYQIIGCKNQVKLQEKLYDKELEILA